jgi:dipeptide/tripeptide permease
MYRDPPRPENTRTLREVLAGAAMVLGDARFMLMIFLYSGFWILYFQNFGSVLWFLRDFIDPTPVNQAFASIGIPLRFDAEHVTVINAGTIILLQVLVSRLVRDRKPLPTMIVGMGIGMLGFVCLSFATNVWVLIVGIAVFSIGEMTAHPKYYSYVGLVAPADRKAVYMGYAFLYGVIGSLLGSNLGGVLYESMLKPLIGRADVAGDIRQFWLLFAAINLVAIAGLVLYNKHFSKDTPETNSRARAIMIGIYAFLTLAGLWFLQSSLFGRETIAYRTLVQSFIMLLIGCGGLLISFRPRTP